MRSASPVLPIRFGAVLSMFFSLVSILISLSYESVESVTLDRIVFAGIFLSIPCVALSGVSLVFFILAKNWRINEGVQYFVFINQTILSLYIGYLAAVMTNF